MNLGFTYPRNVTSIDLDPTIDANHKAPKIPFLRRFLEVHKSRRDRGLDAERNFSMVNCYHSFERPTLAAKHALLATAPQPENCY